MPAQSAASPDAMGSSVMRGSSRSSGSYSGSRTTSKPTHSSNSSISPRVPIPRSGGRYAKAIDRSTANP